MNSVKNKQSSLVRCLPFVALVMLLPQGLGAQEQAPFTREEILYYLRTKTTHYGRDWKQHAKDVDVLCELVKRRGANFKYGQSEGMNGFDKEMHEASGGTTGDQCRLTVVLETSFRAASNPGPGPGRETRSNQVPGTGDIKFLTGTWQMGIGATSTTYKTQGSYVYRTDTAVGAKAGFLAINSDGTYIWKVYSSDSPEKYRKGSWRRASDDETKYYEPPGIVLLKAHDNDNWVVTRYANKDVKGEHVIVVNLSMRASQWFGDRK